MGSYLQQAHTSLLLRRALSKSILVTHPTFSMLEESFRARKVSKLFRMIEALSAVLIHHKKFHIFGIDLEVN